jgi:hypothetical protein
MIETWIDNLAKVWEFNGPGFQMVRSFKLIENSDFPSAINPQDLDKNPIALTIPAAIQPKYAMGHKHFTWYGVTEFHVAPDLERSRLPSLIHWYGLILRAAASHVQLNGTANNFVIVDRQDGILGPLELQYGDEAKHWGFIVNWMVEETPDSVELPVTA